MRERSRPVQLVRHEDDSSAGVGRVHYGVVDKVSARRIQARVRFIEEQQLGSSRQPDSQRASTSLTGGEPPVVDVRELGELKALHDLLSMARGDACRACMETEVAPYRQIVVAAAFLADECDPSTMRSSVRAELIAEDLRRSTRERQDAREEAKEAGLSRAIRSRDEDDLGGCDVEIDARQQGKPVDDADGAHELDHASNGDVLAGTVSRHQTPNDRRVSHRHHHARGRGVRRGLWRRRIADSMRAIG